MNFLQEKFVLFSFVILFACGVLGCEKQGTAEKAGEEIDQTIETAKEKAETAKEEVDEAIDAAQEKLEEVAE